MKIDEYKSLNITEGPWPPLTQLGGGTIFPEWLQEAAQQVVDAHPEQLAGVHANFWCHYYHDDNDNFSLRGEIFPAWKSADRPSEDQLDHLPGMRKMMRLGDELCASIPLEFDSEGHMSGEASYHITRKGFTFTFAYYEEEVIYSAVGRWNGSSWDYQETVSFPDADISETQKAIGDAALILKDIPAKNYRFSDWHSPQRCEFDENGTLTIVFGRGQLALFDDSLT